jgi:hypothetical protein
MTTMRGKMRATNPAFIPRNHLVEETIIAAVNDGDFRLSSGCCRWFPRLTRISQRSDDTPIRRGPIRSCTKRFAAPDRSGMHVRHYKYAPNIDPHLKFGPSS